METAIIIEMVVLYWPFMRLF